jgi:hypothetical protein
MEDAVILDYVLAGRGEDRADRRFDHGRGRVWVQRCEGAAQLRLQHCLLVAGTCAHQAVWGKGVARNGLPSDQLEPRHRRKFNGFFAEA